ncbi:Transmembrane 9 superfamily member [Caenorhabditis elegans]|uniref:Transmembrane 9 superfamily member n=1 Tax=Caenorhabditis elegans TaxID=6239 RepID=G5EFB6_CAEEL|nr:Transmembrane 9 superfamily member [Caenorhabditis elegans]CAD44147.2 Transmembrane 9 superfamily member [Caenorhabditis elegans]|eukprot:NP_741900.2 Uncharacterized protein CELE_R08B4.4 [Caenorhabditis elegans]
MLIPYACVISLMFLSVIFSAISLFTYGWATIYPFDYDYFYPDEEILVGLVPFDSFAPGWLVATSIFMYLNFACVLLTFFICIIGLIIFMLRGDSKYQKYMFVLICGSSLLTAIFGAVAFVIFVASNDGELEMDLQGKVSIGYSPFLDLIGFVIAIIGTGVSAFFTIALLNPNNEI